MNPNLNTWVEVLNDVPSICHSDGSRYDIDRNEARQIYNMLRMLLQTERVDWHSDTRL